MENDRVMEIPPNQRMERQEKLAREHTQEYRQALQRAVALDVPDSYPPPSLYGTFNDPESGEGSKVSSVEGSEVSSVEGSKVSSVDGSLSSSKRRESWGDFVGRLFDTDETGHMVLKQ